MKPSMKAVKANLHGKRVVRRAENMATTDDIAAMGSQLLTLLAEQNIPAEQLLQDQNKFYIKDGNQFWMKPKIKKRSYGVIEFKSSDYAFTDEEPRENGNTQPSYGQLKGLIPLPDNTGFIMNIKGTGELAARLIYSLADA